MTDFTIRTATPADDVRVRRLAALDSRAVPHGELLVGVVAGEIQAAYAPASGRTVANPFIRTAELVELLAVADHGVAEAPAPRRVRALALA